MKIRHMLRILDKRQKRNFCILFIIMLFGTFVELLGVGMIMPLVNVVSNPEVVKEGYYVVLGKVFNLNTISQYVVFIATSLIVVYIIKNIYIVIEYNLQYRFVYNSQKTVMSKIFDCYLEKDYLYHTQHNPSELQRNITSDVENAFQSLLALIQLLTETMVCGVLTLYMLYTDPFSTSAILFLLLVFIISFTLFYKKYSYRLGVKVRNAISEQIKWIHQGLSGIREVKVTDSEIYFSEMFRKSAAVSANSRRKQSIMGLISRPIMETVMICGLLVVMIVKVTTGANLIDFMPTLSLFVVSAFRMLPSFNRITQAYNNIMYGKASIDSVIEELEITRNYEKISDSEKSSVKDLNYCNGDIILDNISFSYDREYDKVLDNVSLVIKDKESTAIIGESGAGKSTLADILLGILLPQSGDVIYNNHSIYCNLKEWHNTIGYIPQMIYLLDDTILRNIAFGITDDDIDIARVWVSLKEAKLDDFVKELPDGLYTQVGDRGIRLSGGQRQRIGIARALYNNPQILIMDEATSALDNDTEKAVMEAIDEMKGERTLIIIAHRLTTIKNCNSIYRVSNKKLEYINYSDILSEN